MKYSIRYIVVLTSKNHSALLYRNLKRKGYNIDLISAPSSISKGCKNAIRFFSADIDIVKEEINNNNLKFKGIYKKINLKGKISYELVK